MGNILRPLLHPYTNKIGKYLGDPVTKMLDSEVADMIDPQYEWNAENEKPTFSGKYAKNQFKSFGPFKKGGKVTRGDGCCVKGGTKGKYI